MTSMLPSTSVGMDVLKSVVDMKDVNLNLSDIVQYVRYVKISQEIYFTQEPRYALN